MPVQLYEANILLGTLFGLAGAHKRNEKSVKGLTPAFGDLWVFCGIFGEGSDQQVAKKKIGKNRNES